MEYDHVAAAHLLVGEQPVPGSWRPVDRLVHQQEVADQQGPLHRFGGNAKRLHDEGEHKERDDDDRQQGAEGIEQVGEDEVSVSVMRARDDGRSCGLAARDRFLRGNAEELRWRLPGQEPLPSATGSRGGALLPQLLEGPPCSLLLGPLLGGANAARQGLRGRLTSATLTSTRKRLR